MPALVWFVRFVVDELQNEESCKPNESFGLKDLKPKLHFLAGAQRECHEGGFEIDLLFAEQADSQPCIDQLG